MAEPWRPESPDGLAFARGDPFIVGFFLLFLGGTSRSLFHGRVRGVLGLMVIPSSVA